MVVAALSATYLGGYPGRPDGFSGIVNVNDHGIEMYRSRTHFSIPWSSVSWLAVEELDGVDRAGRREEGPPGLPGHPPGRW